MVTTKKPKVAALKKIEPVKPKTILQKLIAKGEKAKTNKKWYGKVILVVLAALVTAAFALKKRFLNKKRQELLTEKNKIMVDLKIENQKLKEDIFQDKVAVLSTEATEKKARIEEIKGELKELDKNEKTDAKAFNNISSWGTFNSYFEGTSK